MAECQGLDGNHEGQRHADPSAELQPPETPGLSGWHGGMSLPEKLALIFEGQSDQIAWATFGILANRSIQHVFCWRFLLYFYEGQICI